MTHAYITVVNPLEVARDVERQAARGCRSFVLRQVAGGGMVDQERLGAARYAAGLQAEVMLEAPADVPAAAR
jgi:L-alanine-DL-glutamate epimerase-like enolase superfamily enzyme